MRLNELGLSTLETRRKRGDLIEAFKIIKDFEDVNSDFFFHWQLIMHSRLLDHEPSIDPLSSGGGGGILLIFPN